MNASAHGHSQMGVLGQGVQNIYFQNGSRPAVAQRALVAPPEMVGRDREIAELVGKVRGDRPVVISALHGIAGIGKTALARAVAAEIKDDFPDAWVEVDFYGYTPGLQPADPGAVLADLLSWAGWQGADIPVSVGARMRLWQGWLSSRRVLLILDNARSADQVRPLLPQHAPGCLTLITSRDDLDELHDAEHLRLNTLASADAVDLLRRRGGHAVPSRMLDELAGLCGHLPLTLEPIGLLLARQPAAFVISALRAAGAEGAQRFHHLPDIRQKLQAAFAVSFDALDADRQEALLWCARHPGPDFDATSIGAMAEIPAFAASFRLDDLAGKAMLSPLPEGRYTFHDLFLECARVYDLSERHPGLARLFAHLRKRVVAATTFLSYQKSSGEETGAFADVDAARTWLSVANGELGEAAKASLRDDSIGFADSAGLALGLASWFRTSGQYHLAEELYREILLLASDDVTVQAEVLIHAGSVAYPRGDFERAVELYERARGLYEEMGDSSGLAGAMKGLGDVAYAQGGFGRANDLYERARGLYEEMGDRPGLAHALKDLGDVAYSLGDYGRAVELYDCALGLYEELGSRHGLANTVRGLGDVAYAGSDFGRAVELYERARSLYEEMGDRLGLALTVRGLGGVAFAQGDFGQANDLCERAWGLYEEMGSRQGTADLSLDMARLAELRGDVKLAIHHYEAARKYYESIDFLDWVDVCRDGIGRLRQS
ncbi:tetratricopeptide repeat protein [Herbidospora mongoliensis]|uniref:tetratricopeptide repeat protein n=1 Tax=Herbidospora mongoliensis TaxID=688067 RepID=UPI0014709169|nr:tetratricopeptide repeat protein [Herbidospora mongoliensis]